ncbi:MULTISPECIES: GlxA family transcriptional regulator [Halomonas]|uniref:AraC family transcriptional regulator n=1 Tax=Halomonas halophila TaxID=29573 RepID=A0ABQ0U4B2_9GAMM|nr:MULTISPECIES: GlxA family transcriptional regulator [Halomonas]MDR5890740.1 GlxA family transcriptional regulator [Halomonas salina]RAH38122.1 GlxA family transcriptional regulator [Halomonas sp. SL1]WJY05972.1 GlxA family transcriptional regulator [Halomonas halophila]GEK73280.1 AraC family transcriptional regulator [Halomonas halophila]
MRLTPNVPAPERIDFLLLPRFAMVAFFSAIEPLRIANRISGRPLFEWRLIGRDGEPVVASNGMTLAVDHALDEAPLAPSLAVCASFEPEAAIDQTLVDWLRERAAAGCRLGGMDTGCFVLATAGLLDDQTVTLHWESLPEFRARFPGIDAVESLYEVTPEGFSCAGGSSSIDMSLDLIRRRHGRELAERVRDQLLHDQGRRPASRQRDPAAPEDPTLHRALDLMDANLDTPLEIRRLADELDLSWRRLDRLFARHLGTSPQRAYLARRLDHARRLLQETRHSVMDVALASGFASASSFTRAFRQRHGMTPSELRQRR